LADEKRVAKSVEYKVENRGIFERVIVSWAEGEECEVLADAWYFSPHSIESFLGSVP